MCYKPTAVYRFWIGWTITLSSRWSYQPNDTATPRDDPRFVLWGETRSPSRMICLCPRVVGRICLPLHTHPAGKVLGQGKTSSVSADPPTLRAAPEENSQRVLAAATIERWIAQLTSDLNYDELLNFS